MLKAGVSKCEVLNLLAWRRPQCSRHKHPFKPCKYCLRRLRDFANYVVKDVCCVYFKKATKECIKNAVALNNGVNLLRFEAVETQQDSSAGSVKCDTSPRACIEDHIQHASSSANASVQLRLEYWGNLIDEGHHPAWARSLLLSAPANKYAWHHARRQGKSSQNSCELSKKCITRDIL